MNNSNLYIIDIIIFYLKTYGIVFKKIDLYKAFVTDPNYPSLASISNVLNYYGISSSAFISDKKESSVLQKNMLVHTVVKDGHFFVIKQILKDKVILYITMRKLTFSEQSHIFGGYDAEECRRIQAIGSTYDEMQKNGYDVSDDAWETWCDDYEKYCL